MKPFENIEEIEKKIGLAQAGYSIASFARELGVSHTHVQNVISGKSTSELISQKILEKAKRVKILILDQ